MNKVEELRRVQADLRNVQNQLGKITKELANHPDKPNPARGERVESSVTTQWRLVKAGIEARKVPLQLKILELQSKRDALALGLQQEPVSLASLGYIIDKLTEIEARFSEDSAQDAWEALTAFIDDLERDEKRIKAAAA